MGKVEMLLKAVEKVFNVRMKDVLAMIRTRNTSDARMVICKVCHDEYDMSNEVIGRLIERNHQTVSYNLVCHTKKMANDAEYVNKYNKVLNEIHQ